MWIRASATTTRKFNARPAGRSGCLVGWLVGWWVGRSAAWSVGGSVVRSVGWLVGCLLAWLVGRLVACLVGRSVGCLVGGLVGWLVACLVGCSYMLQMYILKNNNVYFLGWYLTMLLFANTVGNGELVSWLGRNEKTSGNCWCLRVCHQLAGWTEGSTSHWVQLVLVDWEHYRQA
jgi:hypothetical protein